MSRIKFDTYGGDRFEEVARKCKAIAENKDIEVEFDFNGILCIIDKDTSLDSLYRDYSNAHIMEWKEVGPNCPFVYDTDTEILLYTFKLQAAKKRKEQAEAYEKKCAEEKEQTDSVTKGVTFLIHPDRQKDYEAYVAKNSNDGYSRCVIDYAEQWAKLMQVEISKGRTVIAEIADECQKSLGYLGITGFQYGCIVSALSHFWAFGEELRRWHNKEYGVSEDKKGG